MNDGFIRTADQVVVVDILLKLANDAIARGDAGALEALSTTASLMNERADDSEVTLFFDLGEYLYECASAIRDPSFTGDDGDGWREEALRGLTASLAIARRSSS